MRAGRKAFNEFQIPGDKDGSPKPGGAVGVVMADAGGAGTVSPNRTRAAMAINFRIINRFCVVLPARTPRQLIIVRATRTTAASNAATVSLASICPSAQTYFAKVTATAAIPPLCVTRSNAQP